MAHKIGWKGIIWQTDNMDHYHGLLMMLKVVDPETSINGICRSLELIGFRIGFPCFDYSKQKALARLFRTWKYYSGSDSFPIPRGYLRKDEDACKETFAKCKGTRAMWDENTKYGRLRRDLLKHCIETLEKAIQDYEEAQQQSNS